VTLDGERTRGRAVDEAARLAAAARRGQILASGIVRDLAPGSGIRFDPIGGASETPVVYAVTTGPSP
jgi:class 3 adenylate cyclase